ncbi:transposable element Tcb2 transposase [Trichonephila clavipes]|nr:transposable element Tcb2 transposase [Trichonephila clavipes]
MSSADIYRQIAEVYGTETMCDSKVRKWVCKLKDRRINVHDEECLHRPSGIPDDLMQTVETKIRDNKRFMITTLSFKTPLYHYVPDRLSNNPLGESKSPVKTVARHLRGEGLYARRPVACVPLTRQHRTARLQWCREHHNWTEKDWACVLFLDESRFSLSWDCRRQLIWRESGTAYLPEKDRYPRCSIMVWPPS